MRRCASSELYTRGDSHYAGTDSHYADPDSHYADSDTRYAGARCDIRGGRCHIAIDGSHSDGSITEITAPVSDYAGVNIDIRVPATH